MTAKLFPIVVALLLVFGYAQSAHASACAEPTMSIFFVNGIGNTREEARQSTKVLADHLYTHAEVTPECVQVGLAYNHNEPLFLDWVEAWEQKMAEVDDFMVTFWLFLGRVAGASDVFLATLYNAVTLIDPPAYLIDADLDEHLAAYRSEITVGRKVIAVPHSQGNFYANEAWEKLTPEERASFHIVAAATPSVSVADGGPYTTLDEDKLIAAIPLSLPSNLTNGSDFSCEDDWKCHGFKETYLKASAASEDKIVEDILALLIVPPPPSPEEFAELRGTVTYQIRPDDPIIPAVGASSTLLAAPVGVRVYQYATTSVDADGHYSYQNLPLGRYVLRLEHPTISLNFIFFLGMIIDQPKTYIQDIHWGPLPPEAWDCLPLCAE
ncbi:MAG: carboxypeptidase-like regulatory domain-containing protein [bacterium]|nr:carboxypeptidase-like regulatory domain-containing protein [bacterium]MDZ4285158.1 carboxypeptidase-like regulatory domain-containing protein [Patescibacteria group bacterium]